MLSLFMIFIFWGGGIAGWRVVISAVWVKLITGDADAAGRPPPPFDGVFDA
jgi:hypothetical protein